MLHHFFGASVLKRATNIATGADKAYLVKHSYSVSGLSFNPKNDPEQRAQNILEDELKDEGSLIIWHDVIDNSVTKNPRNGTKITPIDLVSHLLKYKHRIACIVYSRREGTEDIFDFLIEKTGILILHAVRHLSSNRNRRQPEYNRELAKLHPDCILELELIEKVKENLDDLWALTKKSRSRKKKPSKHKRDSKKRREEAN